MSELAKVIETAAAQEWQRIRKAEPWIRDTEDTRGAFVVGFALGVHAGMKIHVEKIAKELVDGQKPG